MPVVKIREDIETITKQYKGGKGINSDDDEEEEDDEEETNWFAWFIKDYNFKIHSIKEELAEARASN